MHLRKLISVFTAAALMSGVLLVPAKTVKADGIPITNEYFDECFILMLSETVDHNGNNTLDADELPSITELEFQDEELVSLKGIQYFTYLRTLSFDRVAIPSIDVSGLSQLETLSITNVNDLTTVTFGENSSLIHLYLVDNPNLESIDISGAPLLNQLIAEGDGMTNLAEQPDELMTYRKEIDNEGDIQTHFLIANASLLVHYTPISSGESGGGEEGGESGGGEEGGSGSGGSSSSGGGSSSSGSGSSSSGGGSSSSGSGSSGSGSSSSGSSSSGSGSSSGGSSSSGSGSSSGSSSSSGSGSSGSGSSSSGSGSSSGGSSSSGSGSSSSGSGSSATVGGGSSSGGSASVGGGSSSGSGSTASVGGGSSSGSGSTSSVGGGSSSGSTGTVGGSTSSGGNTSQGNSEEITEGAPIVTTTGVAGFVDRLYFYALGREPDPIGREAWINSINVGESTGASAARGFLFSQEFLGKNVSNGAFVEVLYSVFFDRHPDQAGFDGWVNALDNGADKYDVIEGFINSTEFANICARYNIASGTQTDPSIEVVSSQGTLDFCSRLYSTCLGRQPDEAGLNAWARQLTLHRETGESVARGFFFSSEFDRQATSNAEFVCRLYWTFMDRDPDQAGFDAWVGQLNSGVSRVEVFEGFSQSPEFSQICANYGIEAYSFFQGPVG